MQKPRFSPMEQHKMLLASSRAMGFGDMEPVKT